MPDVYRKIKNGPYIMYLLLLIQTVIFLCTDVFSAVSPGLDAVIYNNGTMIKEAILLNHEWWRLVTPIFIHFGATHYIVNSVTLYFLGGQVERIFGHWRFFAIYMLSGIAGNVLSFAFGDFNSMSAGASTSLFGLFATFIVLAKMFPHDSRVQAVARQYGFFILLNLVFNLFSSGVDILGHLGGLVGGFLSTFAISVPKYQQHDSNIHARIVCGIFYVFLLGVLIFYTFYRFDLPLF